MPGAHQFTVQFFDLSCNFFVIIGVRARALSHFYSKCSKNFLMRVEAREHVRVGGTLKREWGQQDSRAGKNEQKKKKNLREGLSKIQCKWRHRRVYYM